MLIWPWILAALALGAGAALLFLRNRSQRPALAGGPDLDLFTPPQPASALPPRPAPAPARETAVPAPEARGIVSTSLRPWIEIDVKPLRCILTDDAFTIEFELDLFNSGSAPARDIHVAAAVINAGASQEQDLATFYARPAGPGERIDAIQPLKRLTVATQVVTPRAQIQMLEAGGRQVFVPLLAFNALYRRGASSPDGQTSVGFLIGRDNKADKLAPFRLDLGPRLFRGLGARLLPAGVRK